MKELKVYIKPFKKYFNIIGINIANKIIILDRIQIEQILVNKKPGDLWNVDSYDKYEQMTKKYLTNIQSSSGISFKKEFIRFPKELKYLRKFL